jgi:hypothetical protein
LNTNSNNSKKIKKKKDNFLILLPDNLLEDIKFLEVWIDWVEYRKEIKKPLTNVAAKRQIKLLSRYSIQVATAMADQSINMGWRGIFPLNENHELMREEVELADPGSTSSGNLKPL